MATELQILKKRISGFRTAFNTKLRAADSLVKLVLGPPLLKTSTVVTQLHERQTECTESVVKLQGTVEAILSIVEKDDDKLSYDHYVKYLDAVNGEYEGVRNDIITTLAQIEAPIEVVVDDILDTCLLYTSPSPRD